MSPTVLLAGLLAVWRVTHLLNAEDGPADLSVRLRRAAGASWIGAALDCFDCLSLWVAAPFAAALGDDAGERLLLWPALSGAAMIVQRIVAPPRAQPWWHEEEPDELLRKEEDGT